MPRTAAGREEVKTVKSLLWFVLGLSGGFVLAHLVNNDPRGHEVLAEFDARINEFTDRIGDAYRDQQAHLSDLVDSAVSAASDAAGTVRGAVSDIADTAEGAASDVADTATKAAHELAD